MRDMGDDLQEVPEVTEGEMRRAIRRLKCIRSTGEDGLAAEHVKICSELLVPVLVSLLFCFLASLRPLLAQKQASTLPRPCPDWQSAQGRW